MALKTIPTVIFRNPIPTNEGYDIQGLLLKYGEYRESPSLTEAEKTRLMQLAATGEWLADGGTTEDGFWMGDGEIHCPNQNNTLSFILSHYKGHQVSLLNVVYDTKAEGCCGLFCDILGSPTIGKEIRDWVELHGTWYQIDYFLSGKVDVQIKKMPTMKTSLPTVKTSFKNDDDDDGFL